MIAVMPELMGHRNTGMVLYTKEDWGRVQNAVYPENYSSGWECSFEINGIKYEGGSCVYPTSRIRTIQEHCDAVLCDKVTFSSGTAYSRRR